MRVNEPAAVEGYLTRIKPKTQARAPIYVSTHDGNLFVSSTHKAHPPPPPAPPTPTTSPTADAFPAFSTSASKSIAPTSPAKSTKSTKAPPATQEEFKDAERSRSTLQILNSSGLVDLRDIQEIRRVGRTPRPSGPAGGHDAPHSAGAGGSNGASDGPAEEGEDWESLDEDEEDEGGEEALKAGKSRGEATSMSDLRRKRTFEIELTNGEVQTFEVSPPLSLSRCQHETLTCPSRLVLISNSKAHSRLVAREWVDRLNSLRAFWRAKHDRSAIQEMEVSHSAHIHTSDIVNGRRQLSDDDDDERESDEEDTRDPDEPPPYLEDMWNWCAIDACRVITKAGKLFSKRGNRQYRLVQSSLVDDVLLCLPTLTSDLISPLSFGGSDPSTRSSSAAISSSSPSTSTSRSMSDRTVSRCSTPMYAFRPPYFHLLLLLLSSLSLPAPVLTPPHPLPPPIFARSTPAS